MDVGTFWAIIGMLGFLAMLILFILFGVTQSKFFLYQIKYPFGVCWTYLLGLTFSKGEIVNIEDSGDVFFYSFLAVVSFSSSVWVLYLICKWLYAIVIDYLQAHPIKQKSVIKGAVCIVMSAIALPLSINYIRTHMELAEEKRIIAKYCSFDDYGAVSAESLEDCLDYLLSLSDEYDVLIAKVDDDYPSWRESAMETNAFLCAEIAKQYQEQMRLLLNNCTVNIPFSNEDVFSTISNYGKQIRQIIRNCNDGDYSYAFSQYLDIHNFYKEDCVYYLINSIAPEVFEKGLREALLSISVYDGQDELNKIIAYIDSKPSGKSGYESDIAIAQRQLEQEIAEHHAYELNRMKTSTDGYPFYVGMREHQLDDTILGKPDSIELCIGFYELQTRARSKTYEWESNNEHGWYKITVSYRMHNSHRFDDYVDLPSDDGYVSSITWTNGKGVQSVLYADKMK